MTFDQLLGTFLCIRSRQFFRNNSFPTTPAKACKSNKAVQFHLTLHCSKTSSSTGANASKSANPDHTITLLIILPNNNVRNKAAARTLHATTHTIPYHCTIPFPNTIHNTQYKPIQDNTRLSNTIQYNTIQDNTIRYDTMQYHTIPYSTYHSLRYLSHHALLCQFITWQDRDTYVHLPSISKHDYHTRSCVGF